MTEKTLKFSIRLKTSEYGVVETEPVEVTLKTGICLVDCVVVYEKVGENFLFKEFLEIKRK